MQVIAYCNLLHVHQVRDGNNVSGTDRKTCPFYDELNDILGNRAASSTPVLLDSGGGLQIRIHELVN